MNGMCRIGLGALVAACAVGRSAGAEPWPAIKASGSRVLWSAEKAQGSQPLFSPDGRHVAVFVSVGAKAQVLLIPTGGGEPHVAWSDEGAKVECSQLGFSPDGKVLAVLLRHEKEGKVRRSVLFGPPEGKLDWLGVDEMVYEFVFSPGGDQLALSTKEGIVLASLGAEPKRRLILAGKGTVEQVAPYSRLQFAPTGEFLVAIGTIREPFTVAVQGPGVVVFLDGAGKTVRNGVRPPEDKGSDPIFALCSVVLPVSTPYLAVSPDGKQIAGAVWQHSPVGVERPGGLMVWEVADLRAGKTAGRWAFDKDRFIAGVHVYPGATFWLRGGKGTRYPDVKVPGTFSAGWEVACLATELKPEPGQPYRRFGVWQAPTDGQPKRLGVIGPMPKRMFPDPGGRGVILWRYSADAGMYLLDDRAGRFWRFDDALKADQGTLAISSDLRRLAVFKDGKLVLHHLQEAE